MRQDLIKDIKSAMKSANEEALEQQRLLIKRQEDMLTRICLQNQSGNPQGLKRSPSDTPEKVPEFELVCGQMRVDKLEAAGQIQVIEENGNGDECAPMDVTAHLNAPSRGQTWIAENTVVGQETIARSLFKEEGMCIYVADSHAFHAMSFLMIMANAVYIGVEADWNKAATPSEAAWPFKFCDQLFCTFFTCELVVRFFTFRRKRDWFRDNWFLLDSIMVVLMIFETWILVLILSMIAGPGDEAVNTGIFGGMGRMLRLLRLTRISRLMKLIPELVTMVKGMIAAIRAVHAALIILILLVYVFAILMNSLIPEMETFNSVRTSMVTLLVQGVLLDDISGLTRSLITLGSVASLMFLAIFVLLSALTVMNMLIGVLCQVVLDVSAEEKENLVKGQMQKTLLVMLERLDADDSGQLSKAEVQAVICEPEAVAIMMDIQVDTQHLLDLTEMLYVSEDSTLPISVIMNIVLSLRGKRPVNMNDMAKGNNFIMWALETQLAQHREMTEVANMTHGSKMDDLLETMKTHQQAIKDHHSALDSKGRGAFS